MAFGAVFLAYIFVFCLVITVSGNLPDYSAMRLAGVIAILAVSLLLSVVCAAATRWRALITADGVEVVHAFKRERLPWDEITGMSVRAHGPFWDLNVQTEAGKKKILTVPVPLLGLGPTESENYDAAPPHAPRRLRKQYGWLREAWDDHRAATGT
jgi:hypothetical protein